jgi:putative ABC transport system substrate-binding protein
MDLGLGGVGMRRREFISLLGGSVAAWSGAARAQQGTRARRVGVLMGLAESDSDAQPRVTAFLRQLQELGWTDGGNVRIDYRWTAGDVERARAAAKDLVGLEPDVILGHTTSSVVALRQETRTIPIVFTIVSEPVANRFVESLAHPGGNLTGFTNLEPAVGAKWLEILKEIAPHIARIAIIFNPETTPSAVPFSRSAETAAQKLAVGAVVTAIHEPGDIEPVMSTLGREPGGGLIFPPDAFTAFHRKMIIELAARYRLPAIYPFRYFAADGGLVSYGTNVVDQFRQAAVYVDQILRGTKPGDLPVQQPNKFQLVINLKTAKALGLTIPPTLLATADEVIE